MRHNRTKLISLVVWGSFGASSSSVGAEPARWGMTCDAQKRCEMRIAQSEDNREITRILIYRVGGKTLLEYMVPLKINLQRGITIKIADQIFATTSLYCDVSGCIGYALLDKKLLQAMKQGAQLQLAFSPHGDNNFYSFDYTLEGFSVAYETFQSVK